MSYECSTSYLLLIRLYRKIFINIKSLGTLVLEPGFYVYIGSANIRKPLIRIQRHFKKSKKIRWHVDYLTTSLFVEVTAAIVCSGLTEDCMYETILSDKNFVAVAKGFGATDRRHHVTHLFKVKGEVKDALKHVIRKLTETCRAIELVA